MFEDIDAYPNLNTAQRTMCQNIIRLPQTHTSLTIMYEFKKNKAKGLGHGSVSTDPEFGSQHQHKTQDMAVYTCNASPEK